MERSNDEQIIISSVLDDKYMEAIRDVTDKLDTVDSALHARQPLSVDGIALVLLVIIVLIMEALFMWKVM